MHDEPQDGLLKADRRLRQRLLFFLVIFSVLGVALILGLERYLEGVIASAEEQPERAMREVFRLLRLSTLIGGIGLMVFGVYCARFSVRILTSGRFPPPGTKVIRDTRIESGTRARLRGWAAIVLACVLVIMGLAVPWIPDLLIRPLMQPMEASDDGTGGMETEPSPTAPLDPELQAGFQPVLPGRGEISPGPSALSRDSTRA